MNESFVALGHPVPVTRPTLTTPLEINIMRRRLDFRHPIAFLTVVAGVAALSSNAEGGAEELAPVEQPAGTTEPTTPEPTEPDPTEPEPTTPESTTPEPTEPEPTAPTADPATEDPAPVAEPEEPIAPPAPSDDEREVAVSPLLPDERLVRPIAFPVLGSVQYANGWNDCRDDCTRRHAGTDVIGVRMQPLLAATDGTVTRVRYDNVGTAGSVITITGNDGWYYNYFHLNNDTPGTDDGAAGPEWQVAPPLTVGSRVRAGQLIGYMGDSGNAEGSVPHVHFEIRRPDGTPVNPYHSLVAAQVEQTCSPTDALALTDSAELSSTAVAVIPLAGGGRWLIDRDGRLSAEGPAALVDPAPGITCEVIEPIVASVEPVVPAVDPAAGTTMPATAPVTPDATRALPGPWTVEPGESLWSIAQKAYGVSDVTATAAQVDAIVDHNPDLLVDPDLLHIGMTLQLPALRP